MPELNKQEIQSSELNEIMSEIPGSIFNWGLLFFFVLIISLLLGSYLIKNPEIVTVPVIITIQNPPINLIVKTGGEIDKLFVSEGTFIIKDDIVALIRSSCNYADIKILNQFLSEFSEKSNWMEIVRTHKSPPNLILGQVQSNYSEFQKFWKQMKDYIEQAYIPTKLMLLENHMQNKIEYNNELMSQKSLLTEDLNLSKNSFKSDSLLYNQDSSSISAKEFGNSRQEYLHKLYSFSQFNASLKINESDFIRIKEDKLDLRAQYEKEIKQYIINIEESIQVLKSSVLQWEDKYLVRSSTAGKVTFSESRNENQLINSGEILATLIPDSPTNIVARAVIPAAVFGKIEIGQSVNIKISGFPYMRYGVLRGSVCSLSQVPGDIGFMADIKLIDGMLSTYREKIRFIRQIDGTADIIINDRRLIEKFLSPIRSLLRN